MIHPFKTLRQISESLETMCNRLDKFIAAMQADREVTNRRLDRLENHLFAMKNEQWGKSR